MIRGRPILVSLLILTTMAACAPRKGTQDSQSLADEEIADGSVRERLQALYERFAVAREQLVEKAGKQRRQVARAEFESWLAAPSDQDAGASDIDFVREFHGRVIAKGRLKGLEQSTLDLEQIRARGLTRAFCHELPKGGMLHIHPWGTLDRPTAAAILRKVNPPVNFAALAVSLNRPGDTGAIYPAELERLRVQAQRYPQPVPYLDLDQAEQASVQELFFLPPGNHGFDRFTAVFTAISALVFANRDVDPEPEMLEAFFARAARHNVSYVEISRFIVPTAEWVRSLDAWAEEVRQKYGVTARYLAAFARNKDFNFNLRRSDQLLKLPVSKVLTGVNILADETATPQLEFGQAVYAPVLARVLAGQSRLRRTAHAGELGDIRNVRDALIMGVERIGHGVLLRDDPLTLEYARRHKVPIEVNLVSNIRLKVVRDMADHPFLDYLRLGLPVSFSTDDEGIFESTIDDECHLAVKETNITYRELRSVSENAIATAFSDEETRARLRQDLDERFRTFEASWSQRLSVTADGG